MKSRRCFVWMAERRAARSVTLHERQQERPRQPGEFARMILDELRIESYFPLDEPSRRACERLV